MDTANRSVLERRSFWQGHLVQWQASGLSQVTYCRQQGLKMAQFGYWKKRLLAGQTPDTTPAAGFIGLQRASAGAHRLVRPDIQATLDWLDARLKDLDGNLQRRLRASPVWPNRTTCCAAFLVSAR